MRHFYGGNPNGRLRSFCAGSRALIPLKGDGRIGQCIYGQAPRRRLHGIPIDVFGSGRTRKHKNPFQPVIHRQKITHDKPRSASQAVVVRCNLPFRRLAEHLTARRAWCKQCVPGWSKPDVLRPGIVRVQGYFLRTAMYDYTHPFPVLLSNTEDCASHRLDCTSQLFSGVEYSERL